MHKVLGYFYHKIYSNIIRPLILSVSPINEAALGMGIGMFVGLTPTVGIQMWIVFIIWLFFKYVLKIRFDLIIGSAVVWISNPFTMFFFYYAFLKTGQILLQFLHIHHTVLGYEGFTRQLSIIVNNPESNFFSVVIDGSRFLLVDLGIPMVVGCLIYSIPISILSYFLTRWLLLRYRINKALSMGMDYESWRLEFEKRKIVPAKKQPSIQ